MLHRALQRKDLPEVERLMLSAEAAVLLNERNPAGCTPLMVMLSQNTCSDALIHLALERGAIQSISCTSRKKHTAADYATMNHKHELAERIKAIAEGNQDGRPRCDRCCAILKPKSRCAHLEDCVSRGEETNPLLLELFQVHADAAGVLGSGLYHQVNCMKHFRKEVCEAMVMMDRWRQRVEQQSDWLVVDLCSGKGVTGCILGLLFPEVRVACIDLLDVSYVADDAHHYHANVTYHQLDVLSDRFLDNLEKLVVDSGRPRVGLLGMHLCGGLSEQAIRAYHQIEQVEICVLCPCCLPNKSGEFACSSWYESKDQQVQYRMWVEHLQRKMMESGQHEHMVVVEDADEILPPSAPAKKLNHSHDRAARKNTVIVGQRIVDR
eukprot:TRINITY_DN60860_c0_g1_i1.p1 TRINITY_DN60860_c0_g1~~TRINITY_DN60860_c0_g1_i1.p1  ORF type:complete len:380 (-),score=64.32 TRINITY_DN60860_c0_g1_i1:200-1339(-)